MGFDLNALAQGLQQSAGTAVSAGVASLFSNADQSAVAATSDQQTTANLDQGPPTNVGTNVQGTAPAPSTAMQPIHWVTIAVVGGIVLVVGMFAFILGRK